jgi:hypothetical protein
MRLLTGSLLLLALVAGCSRRTSGGYGCGFAAVAGQSMLLDQFNQPGRVLGSVPAAVPESLPVRLVLGPAFRSVTGRVDTLLVVGLEGELPATPVPGFGVLVVNPGGEAQGVLLYEGEPIPGAPRLGSVNAAGRDLPLIGLRLDITQFENADCPIFPDSLRR